MIYKLKTPQIIEKTVVRTYKNIENGVVDAYRKIEDKFVDTFLEKAEDSGDEPKTQTKP